MKIKNLWRGCFNINRHIHIKYAYAYTEDQARLVMVRKIAKDQEVLPVVIFGYLKDHPNSSEIKIEVKFEEVEDD